jgi:hypothetical protein
MALPSLTSEQVKSLSVHELITRMDLVRVHAEEERYGAEWLGRREKSFPVPRVADLLTASRFREMAEPHQRRLVDAAFRFLMQSDLLNVSAGIANAVIYDQNYSNALWASPRHWMRAAVLGQYEIVASRIALECFFDLIYIADQGDRMPGKSKFKAFRTWIVQKNNPYKYFVGHIVRGFEFDREHRQKEVHGTSRFAQSLLRLEIPDSDELNISNQLTNVLLSVWAPFIQILQGNRPSSIDVFDTLQDFPTKYFDAEHNPDSFDQFIVDLLADRFT